MIIYATVAGYRSKNRKLVKGYILTFYVITINLNKSVPINIMLTSVTEWADLLEISGFFGISET